MLDVSFIDTFTIRRAQGRSSRNEVTYGTVLDGHGAPLQQNGLLELRRRRVHTVQGVEAESDATLIHRVKVGKEVKPEDLVVCRGETFRVIGSSRQRLLFGDAEYARLDLQKVRTPIPGDEPVGE